MNLVRGQNYTMAGYTGSDQEKFNLLTSAYVLDGTAGQGYDTYDGTDYRPYARTRREAYGVSMKRAIRIVGCLALAMIIWISVNAIRIRRLAYQVDQINVKIEDMGREKLEQDQKIVKARDMSSILTEASLRFHMIPQEEAECYEVEMPDTRPFGAKEQQ